MRSGDQRATKLALDAGIPAASELAAELAAGKLAAGKLAASELAASVTLVVASVGLAYDYILQRRFRSHYYCLYQRGRCVAHRPFLRQQPALFFCSPSHTSIY